MFGTKKTPPVPWRCFHCNANGTARTFDAARLAGQEHVLTRHPGIWPKCRDER